MYRKKREEESEDLRQYVEAVLFRDQADGGL
jgi:hypothetical protein